MTRSWQNNRSARLSRETRGSVLIIVLWISFGLVSVALYFSHSMVLELRAADNRVAETEADQAIEGAARYVTYILSNLQVPGMMPDLLSYERDAVPVGQARFWLIGRSDQENLTDEPFFSLIDEGSKLNLNKVDAATLVNLPRMTTEFAAAIQDWRDADSNVTPSGAEADNYSRLNPPYKCKNADFETVDELRLVYGAQLDLLYGEDSNLNGVLDPNENDGNTTLPIDNRDGRLDSGLLNYVTVYTRESTNAPDGTVKTNPPGGPYTCLLDYYAKSGMKPEEFALVADYIMIPGAELRGLINVNTASAEVLACVTNMTPDQAQSLVSYRRSNPDNLRTIAWVVDSGIISRPEASVIGRYLTVHSYQYTADVAAVGHHGRGYRRVRFVFDTSSGTPRIIFRQDLSHLGWALGKQVRQRLLLAKNFQ